jgi:hypothetical protein
VFLNSPAEVGHEALHTAVEPPNKSCTVDATGMEGAAPCPGTSSGGGRAAIPVDYGSNTANHAGARRAPVRMKLAIKTTHGLPICRKPAEREYRRDFLAYKLVLDAIHRHRKLFLREPSIGVDIGQVPDRSLGVSAEP